MGLDMSNFRRSVHALRKQRKARKREEKPKAEKKEVDSGRRLEDTRLISEILIEGAPFEFLATVPGRVSQFTVRALNPPPARIEVTQWLSDTDQEYHVGHSDGYVMDVLHLGLGNKLVVKSDKLVAMSFIFTPKG